jgi:hypothetical protein
MFCHIQFYAKNVTRLGPVAVRCSWTVAVTSAPVRRHFDRLDEFIIFDQFLELKQKKNSC